MQRQQHRRYALQIRLAHAHHAIEAPVVTLRRVFDRERCHCLDDGQVPLHGARERPERPEQRGLEAVVAERILHG